MTARMVIETRGIVRHTLSLWPDESEGEVNTMQYTSATSDQNWLRMFVLVDTRRPAILLGVVRSLLSSPQCGTRNVTRPSLSFLASFRYKRYCKASTFLKQKVGSMCKRIGQSSQIVSCLRKQAASHTKPKSPHDQMYFCAPRLDRVGLLAGTGWHSAGEWTSEQPVGSTMTRRGERRA